MLRPTLLLLLASVLVVAGEAAPAAPATPAAPAAPALSGTWVGTQPTLPATGAVVMAMYDRNGTCCGGPAAALAGLANLQTALSGRTDVALLAVDVTTGATPELAAAAAKQHHVETLPLLVDAARASAKAMAVEIDMTMTYVVRKSDGTQEVVHSPARVKKVLGL
jgi:hypothetical protein